MKPLDVNDFWRIKHQIDEEVARLGWAKEKCKRYIEFHYGRTSRLEMTDMQLVKLLDTLRALPSSDERKKSTGLKTKRRKGKRFGGD